MSLNTIKEIEQAVGLLRQLEIKELYAWLDQHFPQPIDAQVQAEVEAGCLDTAIDRALDGEKDGARWSTLTPVEHRATADFRQECFALPEKIGRSSGPVDTGGSRSAITRATAG